MRRGLVLGSVLGLLNSALVLVLVWALEPPTEFGWYAYSPMPRRYSDYLPASRVHGWTAVALVAVALTLANALIVGVWSLVRKRRMAT